MWKMKLEKEGEKGYIRGPHRDWQKTGRRKLGRMKTQSKMSSGKKQGKKGEEGREGTNRRRKIVCNDFNSMYL